MLAAAAVALYVLINSPFDFSIDRGQSTTLFGSLSANGPVTHPHLHMQVADGLRATNVRVSDWACVQNGGAIDCTTASYAATESLPITLDVQAPADSPGGSFPVTAVFTSDEDPIGHSSNAVVNVRHHIPVRSTADSGEDTLRAAIESANRDCPSMPDCQIDFDLAQPATIDLVTPLPTMTAPELSLSGNITLSGAHLASGSGLLIRPHYALYPGYRIRGLTIHDFPENGIDYAGWTPYDSGIPFQIRGCVIEHNGLRGVSVSAASALVDFELNTIDHNSRSGVALWETDGGSLYLNTITWNGAAGIYIGTTHQYVGVDPGLIAFNEIGVSIDSKNATAAVIGNAVDANIIDDLDWGIDGNNGPDREGGPPIPVLLSATYDPVAKATTVNGELRRATIGWVRIMAYASDHVTRWGNTPMTNLAPAFTFARRGDTDAVTPFSLTFRGDYRGAYISAQSSIQAFPDLPIVSASELSTAIRVPK